MPRAEVDITAELARRLIARQFPDLAQVPINLLASGWDNVLFRVGDDLVARLPRRQVAVPLIEAEQRWLPDLAARLPLPIPAPVRCGQADDDFPWPWSICPFVPGTSVLDLVEDGGSLADPERDAARLGGFTAALHQPAPPDAPENEYRGVPLVDRDERFRSHVVALRPLIDPDAPLAAWEVALAVPPWRGPGVWIHGDLHPGNVIADERRISSVVDFGDLTSGDPATDLAAAWMFFDGPARDAFRSSSGADGDSWARARGWALCLGVATAANSADNPAFTNHGLRTIAAVLDDH